MSDGTNPPAAQTGLTIPDEIAKNFPDLIVLIKGSESMNDEERQYWINILPVMTPDQIQNLRDILENEKKQLAAIDEKYKSEIETIGQAELVQQTEDERRKKRQERQSKEATHHEQEEQAANDLLKSIEEDPKP